MVLKKNTSYKDVSENISQEKLWLKFIAGNDFAIDNIYRQNYQALYAYGQRFNIGISEVEDAIQTLFVNLFKYRKSLKPVDNVRSYIFRSFRNIILKNNSSMPVFLLIDNVDVIEENERSHSEELILEVKKTINDLSPREREIILLKYFEDYKNPEIAEILGIENKTVRNLISRALNKFRKIEKK